MKDEAMKPFLSFLTSSLPSLVAAEPPAARADMSFILRMLEPKSARSLRSPSQTARVLLLSVMLSHLRVRNSSYGKTNTAITSYIIARTARVARVMSSDMWMLRLSFPLITTYPSLILPRALSLASSHLPLWNAQLQLQRAESKCSASDVFARPPPPSPPPPWRKQTKRRYRPENVCVIPPL